MTQAQCVSLLRELRGLERLITVVQAQMMTPGAAIEWTYGLVALTDRRRWLAYCVSLEHPVAVSMAEELLAAQTTSVSIDTKERQQAPVLAAIPDPPGPRVVH